MISELVAPVTIMIFSVCFDTSIIASAVAEVGTPTIMSTPSVSHHLRAIDAATSGLFSGSALTSSICSEHDTAKVLDRHLRGFEIANSANVGINGSEVRKQANLERAFGFLCESRTDYR